MIERKEPPKGAKDVILSPPFRGFFVFCALFPGLTPGALFFRPLSGAESAGMKVLGIESSCDETAAAVLTDKPELLSNIVASQISVHHRYGGVVPELASREHLRNIGSVVELALSEAHTSMEEIGAVAVTYGPGLIGSLLVG